MSFYESEKNNNNEIFPTDRFISVGNGAYIKTGSNGAGDNTFYIMSQTSSEASGIKFRNVDYSYLGDIWSKKDNGLYWYNNISGLNLPIQNVCSDGSNWYDCPGGKFMAYKYEGNGNSLPCPYCMIYVAKSINGNRGIAFAFNWNNGSNNFFINKMHDTWQGWVQIR